MTAGTVAYDGPPHTDDWFATRRTGITATDIAAITTEKYEGALGVYADKTGHPRDFHGNDATKLGQDLEPVALSLFARDMSTPSRPCYVEPVPIIRSANDPWALASLDGLAYRSDWPEPALVEAKAWGQHTGTWKEEVPDSVFAQIQWGLKCTGLSQGYAALIVTGVGFSIWSVPRDQGVIDWLTKQGHDVWQQIQMGIEPEVSPDGLSAVERLHGNRAGEVQLDADASDALARYRAAQADHKVAEDEKKRAYARLVQLLGDAKVGLIHGRKAVSYDTSQRTSFDTKRFRADHPQLADDYTTSTTVRTLRLSKEAA